MPTPKCGSFVSQKLLHSVPSVCYIFHQASWLFVVWAGRQAPRFFHILGQNTNNSSRKMALGVHRGTA